MASPSENASLLLEHNQKLVSETDYSLDLNQEKLDLLSKMLESMQAAEKDHLSPLFEDLLQKQFSLKQNFEEKLKKQTQLKLDLLSQSSLLAQKVGELKEKEEDLSIISGLDKSSSIIFDNELQIQELTKRIKEKEELKKELIELDKEHAKEVLDKKAKKISLIESQIFYSEKKRKLDEELYGKKKELKNASQSFRDLETGRLEQTLSPKSQFFLDSSSIRRSSPAKDSTFLDYSAYPTESSGGHQETITSPVQKPVPDHSKNTTLFLLGVIFLLVGLISKLLLT